MSINKYLKNNEIIVLKGILISTLFLLLFQLNGQTFQYDDLNRLTKADYGQGYVIEYSYDKLGNRTSKIVQAGCWEVVPGNAYLQSFENGLGDWRQLESDDRNWAHQSGATATSNSGPGAATDANAYLFTEATSSANRTFTIESQCFSIPSGTSPSLTLDYHMYGTQVGSLQIQVSINGGSFTSLFSRTGNQGNVWNQFSQSLSSYAGSDIRFRIVATTGGGDRSDIAIDNIRFGNGCPDNLVVSNTLNNNFTTLPGEEYLAQQKVNSTAILNSGVYHFGAEEIEMNEGFEVKRNVLFQADDQGCVTTSSIQNTENGIKR